MDFKWSEELESMRKMAYDFAVKNIKPTMEEDEKEHKYRPELLKKMGDQGMFGCLAPEQYGGLGLEEGHLAAALMAVGRFDEAREQCREALRLDPNLSQARQLWEKLAGQ